MAWIGAAIGAVGGLLSSSGDSNGGAGTQQQKKEPWGPAQPWLLQNLLQGQQLQNQYTAAPFSPRQEAAYDNSYAQSDYVRELIPSLLSQMQQQPVGFDPANPLARPKAWDWNALANGANGLGQRSVANEAAQAPVVKQEEPLGQFTQQNDVLSGMNMTGQTTSGGLLGSGGYGAFKYGQDVKPGTKEYRDMQEYFLLGGVDPNNMYGKGDQGQAQAVYRQTNPRYSHPIFDQWRPMGSGGTVGGQDGNGNSTGGVGNGEGGNAGNY